MIEAVDQFVTPETETRPCKGQMFVETIKDWLEHQRESKAASSTLSLTHIINEKRNSNNNAEQQAHGA